MLCCLLDLNSRFAGSHLLSNGENEEVVLQFELFKSLKALLALDGEDSISSYA